MQQAQMTFRYEPLTTQDPRHRQCNETGHILLGAGIPEHSPQLINLSDGVTSLWLVSHGHRGCAPHQGVKKAFQEKTTHFVRMTQLTLEEP